MAAVSSVCRTVRGEQRLTDAQPDSVHMYGTDHFFFDRANSDEFFLNTLCCLRYSFCMLRLLHCNVQSQHVPICQPLFVWNVRVHKIYVGRVCFGSVPSSVEERKRTRSVSCGYGVT